MTEERKMKDIPPDLGHEVLPTMHFPEQTKFEQLHFASFVSFRLVTNLNPSKLRNRELCSP